MVIAVLIAALAGSADARTWHIMPDASGDAPTIQAALDSAASGDVVLLAPGTYSWTSQNASGASMIVIDRNVALRGASGAAATILDAEQQGRVIQLESDLAAELEGLTITNGRARQWPPRGGGVRGEDGSDLRVTDCILRDNTALLDYGTGGGIGCFRATITNCRIENNLSSDGAGVEGTDIVLSGCSIRGNRAYGHGSASGGGVSAQTATIADCWFEGNIAGNSSSAKGGGVRLRNGSIARCTFVNNTVWVSYYPGWGGAVFCDTGPCTIETCVFVGNRVDARSGKGAAVAGYEAEIAITACTLVGNRATSPSGYDGPSIIEFARGSVRMSIIAWNEGAAVRSPGVCDAGPVVSSCNLFGNSAGGNLCAMNGGRNFSADPQFCAEDAVTSLNFALQADSPCASGNHPDGASGELIGSAPVGCGSVSVETTTWSRLKSLFR